ncbi:MAG TPA: 3-methyl-2-oxobutanoate dehydrogenase subunit VorB [Candidatus Wallbacteria bacterium]|nr:3-methyl-2-oxobutanoate dehydrogenase subunit VorB [Candidatus Wallbacteria bacterium]
MSKKVLMKGNEALGQAAILAGCRHYFGYPITPQSELPAYLAKHLPKINGVFLQAESEVAAINMVYGSGGTGVRVMTSSSSPGVSLKQEGLSYIACAEVPCLIVNVVRGGPGLGNIAPAQSDYFQAVKGGGHGDYRLVVLSPSSVQEMADYTFLAFDIADKYRTPVMMLSDGYLGQMMEPVMMPDASNIKKYDKPWATTGAKGRKQNLISSIHLVPEDMEKHIHHLYAKYAEIEKNELRYEEFKCEDAEYVIVAYGITARICKTTCTMAREQGIKIGLLRPKTLWPYPTAPLAKLAGNKNVKGFIAVELSMGQMVEDVRLAVNGKKPVEFYGRTGGVVPSPTEVLANIKKLFKIK